MKAIAWSNGIVVVLDARLLPGREVYHICRTYPEVAEAIRSGAVKDPAVLRIATAMGIALGAHGSPAETPEEFDREFEAICLAVTRAREGDDNLVRVAAQSRATYHKYRAGGMLVVRIALIMEALILQAEESVSEDRLSAGSAGEGARGIAPPDSQAKHPGIHPWA